MTDIAVSPPRRRAAFGLAAALALLALLALAAWIATAPRVIAPAALGPHAPDLANGRTLFLAGDCSACHASPRQADPDRLGGGLGLVSKYGTFYAPNISADRRDGIGGWSEAQFLTAMKNGVSRDGRHLYPVFPYASFQRMTAGDLRDLFAYLKTLPAVPGRAPAAQLKFPFNQRRLMGAWKLLFLDGRTFTPDPTRSAAWNRGAYLVNGPAHCAECHSPRNLLGAIPRGRRFAGAPNAYGVLGFPNITQANLKAWPADSVAEMLRSGLTPEGDRVGGPMTEVVRATSQLSDEDRLAMDVYVRSLAPAGPAAKPAPAPRE